MSALGALLFIGCSSLHTLTIDLYTDLTPGTEFDAVEIEIDGVAATPFAASEVRAEGETRIHESMLTDGRHMVRVSLSLAGTSVISQDYVVQLERDLIVAARLRRSCVGVNCDDGVGCTLDNCDEGVCTHVPDATACGLTACDPDVVGADAITGCAPGGVCLGRAPGFACRISRGACDVEETCDGVAEDCPVDLLLQDSTVCREGAGDCDVAESCLGNAVECPVDQRLAMGTECRPSAGDCDTIEVCDGESAACPADAFVDSETVCRASLGVCDQAETCSGSTASCPTDAFLSSGTECRPALSDCDEPELCGGSDAGCPASALFFDDSARLDASDAMRPLLGQLTADAFLDVVAWGADRVQVLTNTGGRLRAGTSYTYPETLRGLALADLDGDRVLDLVALLRGRLVGRRGRGDGTFATTTNDVLTSSGLEVGTTAMMGIAADVRQLPTTVVLLRDRTVLTTRSEGAMRLGLGPSYPVERHTALAVGDVDGDGLPDIVTSGDLSFSLLLRKADGTFAPGDSPYPVHSAATAVMIRPLHCEPFGDVAFMDPAGAVVVAKWDGTTFDEVAELDGPALADFALTDLDGDGGMDVVGLTPARGLVYWRSTGELTWGEAETFDDERMIRWLLAFDGDGRDRDELLSGDGAALRVMTR
jgi:hypothetical protein